MFDNQTKRFCSAVVDALPDLPEDIMQGWIGNPKGLQKALRVLNPKGIGIASASQAEAPLDTIIRVDRSVRPVYPDFVQCAMHPDLETVGPKEYDIAKVELYFHPEQRCPTRRHNMTGEEIYQHLKKTDSLKNCLGVHDALAIERKGAAVFQKFFRGNTLCCWKSVVKNGRGRLLVPCVRVHDLVKGHKSVMGEWKFFDIGWPSNYPAARFASE